MEKRAQPTDESPGARVVALCKALSPTDPFGEGLRRVQQQYPETWHTYRTDYA